MYFHSQQLYKDIRHMYNWWFIICSCLIIANALHGSGAPHYNYNDHDRGMPTDLTKILRYSGTQSTPLYFIIPTSFQVPAHVESPRGNGGSQSYSSYHSAPD